MLAHPWCGGQPLLVLLRFKERWVAGGSGQTGACAYFQAAAAHPLCRCHCALLPLTLSPQFPMCPIPSAAPPREYPTAGFKPHTYCVHSTEEGVRVELRDFSW